MGGRKSGNSRFLDSMTLTFGCCFLSVFSDVRMKSGRLFVKHRILFFNAATIAKNKDEKHYRNAYIAYIDVCDKLFLFLLLLRY